jgi:hypothetical protein
LGLAPVWRLGLRRFVCRGIRPTLEINGRAAYCNVASVVAPGIAARKGISMKTVLAVLALCAFAPSALAAGAECRSIESTGARLACYDAASPPKIVKPAAAEKDAPRGDYKDPFLAEDARTTAKLNGICRGC